MAGIAAFDNVLALERAILANDMDRVCEMLAQNGPFEFTARALALAMRFCGPDMVRTLLDEGATFSYTVTRVLRRRYACGYGFGWIRQVDYAAFLFPGATGLDAFAAQMLEQDAPPACTDEEARLEVIRLLTERHTPGIHSYLFYSILYHDVPVMEYLHSAGITQIPAPPLNLLAGSIPANQINTLCLGDYIYAMRTAFESFDDAALLEVLETFYEHMGCQLGIFRYNLIDLARACSPALLPRLVQITDLMSKTKRWEIIDEILNQNNAGALDYVLKNKWVRSAADLEFMLQRARASESPSPEVISRILEEMSVRAATGGSGGNKPSSVSSKTDSQAAIRKSWGFSKLEDGTWEITSYKGQDTEVVIPAYIGNVPVTSISVTTFMEHGLGVNPRIVKVRENITRIEFPGTIKTIPENLMDDPGTGLNVDTIILNEGTEMIGDNAFAGLEKLTHVSLPCSLRTIGRSAFLAAVSLKSIEFPDELEVIDIRAFYACGLQHLVIPPSVKFIGAEAFAMNGALADAKFLPSQETGNDLDIDRGAFGGCSALANVEFSNRPRFLGSQTFTGCGMESITVPASVRIGYKAFENCQELKTVHVDESVSMDVDAFSNCPKLADESEQIVVNGALVGFTGALLEQVNDGRKFEPPIVLTPHAQRVPTPFDPLPSILYRPSEQQSHLVDAQNLRLGDKVLFGHFPQDTSFALEPISWIVLCCQDSRTLLLAERAIMRLQSNWMTWGWTESRLRWFLNGTFLRAAFTDEERLQVCPSQVAGVTFDKPEVTLDRIFVLTADEVGAYLPDPNGARRAIPTEYALEQTSPTYQEYLRKRDIHWGHWQLRPNKENLTLVNPDGEFETNVFSGSYLRPALWIGEPPRNAE